MKKIRLLVGDRLVLKTGLKMIMFHGSPLMRRVNEIIDHVVEASIYNYWISLRINNFNLRSRKMALLHPLD